MPFTLEHALCSAYKFPFSIYALLVHRHLMVCLVDGPSQHSFPYPRYPSPLNFHSS